MRSAENVVWLVTHSPRYESWESVHAVCATREVAKQVLAKILAEWHRPRPEEWSVRDWEVLEEA